MCLLIPLRKEHKRNGSLAEDIFKTYLSVAESDITIYKVLEKTDKDLVSPYQRALYQEGETYKADFSFAEHATSHIGSNRVYDHLAIHKGLHGYATLDAATKDTIPDRDVVCRFTIPKGALVFKEGDEVCSNAYKFEKTLCKSTSS